MKTLPNIPQPLLQKHKQIGDWSILQCFRGSIAHGTYRPSTEPNSIDDIDTMGVCIPPKDNYLGMQQYLKKGTKEIKEGEWDIVCYELKKAVSLLCKGNPNISALLWTRPEHVIQASYNGVKLIHNRDLFSSKQAYNPFVGYAKDQLYKMEHLACKGYMGEKRKQLVNKFGYDTKNASHCIRLLRMGVEFFQTEKFNVYREDDAQELLDIKDGKWSLDKIKHEADLLFKEAKIAYDKTNLPDDVDHKKINELVVEMLELSIKYEK